MARKLPLDKPYIKKDDGLEENLINAKIGALQDNGIDIENFDISFIESEAKYIKEAIINFLTHEDCKFKITKLNAPVIVENLRTPDQTIDVHKETITEEKKPLFETIKRIGNLIPGAGTQVNVLVNQVDTATDKTADLISIDGATMPGLNLSKDGDNDTNLSNLRIGQGGGLISNGYVFVGEDPESQKTFNVSDESGQRDFTEVKLFRDDIEELL